MPSIIYEPISPEDEARAMKALYQALRDNARRLREMAAARLAAEQAKEAETKTTLPPKQE